MKLTVKTTSYNRRRYGKPWIAVVDFSSDPKGKFTFGQWVGDDGEDGLLVIDAEEGKIIATGQKDYRGRTDPPVFYQVRNGELTKLANRAEAYKLVVGDV